MHATIDVVLPHTDIVCIPPTLTLLQVVSPTLTLYPLLHCIHQRTIQSALFHIMLLHCYVLCSCILNNSACTSYLVHTWLHLFFC